MRFVPAVLVLALLAGCGKPQPVQLPTTTETKPVPEGPSVTPPAAGGSELQAIDIPADGKLENVKVCGVTVPMVNIMDGGTVVLVDTDGVKPRSWEEQYKRKGSLPKGYFDLHKANKNKNDTFEDDDVDRQGRWKMDEKGNIVQD